ncbi:sugar diacid recognition domain-containing protein [Citrobacter farmeri]|uniref:sugar diacid recognition domain-containing protein n=1 Tax=Citrobacter farmeri TaxID=67824 RepID=UPI002A82A3DD|nr:sugar diacid recognition domain-containing protein [Citrobacter farmeri]
MTSWHLESKIAQDIVDRAMDIIDININIMDAHGRIVGSGDAERIGKIHEGALLVLSQNRVLNIDDSVARRLFGVYQGINLPLHLNGEVVGVIGLTGDPDLLIKFGELVCMAAEMMLEQARLISFLTHDNRLREEFVMSIIKSETYSPTHHVWAQKLRVNIHLPRVAILIEGDLRNGQSDSTEIISVLQSLQKILVEQDENNLIAIISPVSMAILLPALNNNFLDEKEHLNHIDKLISRTNENDSLVFRVSQGKYFPGEGGIARSWRTAKASMFVGKQRMPKARCYSYQQLMLPVLLNSLKDSWQASEILSPVNRLKLEDKNGLLLKTLTAWFRYDLQPQRVSKALFIHRNTLEYRLKKIADLTELDLDKFENRVMLYIATQLYDTQ